MDERIRFKTALVATLTAVLWGGNAVSIKIALGGVPPFSLALLRFFLGSAVVLFWCLNQRISLKLKKTELRNLLILTLLFVMQISLLNLGTRLTYASHATLFLSTYPLFTLLFAHFFIPGDRLTFQKLAGMLLSFTGVIVIFADALALGGAQHLPGDILTLSSGVLLGLRLVYTKRLTESMPSSKVLLWQGVFSMPLFFVLSLLFERGSPFTINGGVIGAALYQGVVVAGLCFLLWTSLLQRHAASNLSVFGFLTPICGVLLSGLLLSETLSPLLLLSMGLIGLGILTVNLRRKIRSPH